MYSKQITIPFKPTALLPAQMDERPTLVLDLDETLVHCSLTDFKYRQFTFDLQAAQTD
jgi:hypothetical protein